MNKPNHKHNWTLINNNSHYAPNFTSEKKLKEYAKAKGWIIKRSYLDRFCFYVDSYEYIPAR